METVGGLEKHRAPFGIRGGNLFQKRTFRVGVHARRGFKCLEPRRLSVTSGGDPCGHGRAVIARRRQIEIGEANGGNFQSKVETVHKRTGDLAEVILPAQGCATAGLISVVDDTLRGLGVDSLIISGVSTAYVVESSVRHATDIGYHCTVVADACATATNEQHEAALRAMTPLAEITTVDKVLAR